jgi:poly(3-hydroxybutyrate) depolymerase
MRKPILSLLLTGYALSSMAEPNLELDLTDVTVSGLSAGGYMASQFHIANSDWVSGAAILAAGPYYCGQNSITTALSQCVNKVETPIDITSLNATAATWAMAQKIAPLSALKTSKVWLFHGNADTRVAAPVSAALYEQYKTWVTPSNITYVNDKAAAHVFPTLAQGGSCLNSESPFIGRCEYDAAGIFLQAIIGGLTPPDNEVKGKIIEYNQHEIGGDDANTLAETGYAFVPENCANGEVCKVHVSFHGCNQYADAVDLAYVEQTGLNPWADDNNIVVFYPQTRKSLFMPLNPQGCWDWWGYTGPDYATRNGPQIKAVTAILTHFSN